MFSTWTPNGVFKTRIRNYEYSLFASAIYYNCYFEIKPFTAKIVKQILKLFSIKRRYDIRYIYMHNDIVIFNYQDLFLLNYLIGLKIRNIYWKLLLYGKDL